MKTWRITLNGRRSQAPVKGQITLLIEAETREEAGEIAQDSIPGFDWTGWTTLYGVVEDEEVVATS